MKKNILLIQPKIGETDSLRTHPALPLSLLHAAVLTSPETQIRIIDQRIEKHWEKQIIEKIDRDTLLAGITSFTGPMITEARKAAVIVRKTASIPIVWGGVHASLLPANTLADQYVDAVVRGEGELTLFELVQALAQGNSWDTIPGLSYKKNGQIYHNPERELLNLDSLPDLPYQLIDVTRHLPLYQGKRSFYFQTSRGCPYSCSYCYNPVFNRKKWRKLSAPIVLERLKRSIRLFPIQDIYFLDDNFFLDLERAEEIMRGLKGINISWQVQGADIPSLQEMDDEFLQLLSESGCTRITLGIESGSPKIRALMRKKGSVQEIIEQIARFDGRQISIYCNFLAGLPTETLEDLKMTINLILKLVRDFPWVQVSPLHCFTPYPQTPLFNLAVEHGYEIPGSLAEWGKSGGWDQNAQKHTPGGRIINYPRLYFLTNLLDHKTESYNTPKIITFAIRLYKPIAQFRLKRLFLSFPIEEILANSLKYIWMKIRVLLKKG